MAYPVNTTDMILPSQINPLTGSTIAKHPINSQSTDFPHNRIRRNASSSHNLRAHFGRNKHPCPWNNIKQLF
jgi:hypothetical protein